MEREELADLIDILTKKAVDDGKLIEVGWLSLRHSALSPKLSEQQMGEIRKVFFAGAAHLYGSIMGFLEGGEEPTANDERRMELIATEIEEHFKSMRG